MQVDEVATPGELPLRWGAHARCAPVRTPRTHPMRVETHGRGCPIEEAIMQRWEYLEVQVHQEHWIDSLGRRGKLPSERAYGASYGETYFSGGLLNELGEQGWELAGVPSSMDQRDHKLLLKRPRD